MKENKQGGLVPIEKDERDFELGQIISLPDLSELPETFELKGARIRHQGTTDFCSAYTTTGMSELQEGMELNPNYSFALSKKVSGNPEAWGQNMRDAMKAHVKYGALEQTDYEGGMTEDDMRYIEKYPSRYYNLALKHQKKSYFKVTGPVEYDAYDNIMAAIWHFKAQKQGVAIGCVFSWSLQDYILTGKQDNGFGHMMWVSGWANDGLIIVNSYGINAGKDGKHRMTRETINHFADRYGIYMMVDIPPVKAKELIARSEWAGASYWGKLVILFKRMLWE